MLLVIAGSWVANAAPFHPSSLPLSGDLDGDGLVDYAPNTVLVILKDGVEPTVAEHAFFGAKQSPGKLNQLQGVQRSAFGQFVQRLDQMPSLRSLRILTPGKSVQTAAKSTVPIRHVLKLELDGQPESLRTSMTAMLADPAVSEVEPDYVQRTDAVNDPYFSSRGAWGQAYQDQWYLHIASAPQAWSLASTAAPPVVVAVIDTGIDRNHPDLAGQVWSNGGEIAGNGIDDDQNGFVDDVYGWNFAAENNDSLDTYGHGTLVAGIIGARQDNAFGIAGAAPHVRLMALRNGGAGGSYVSDSIAALYYAVNNGAAAVNMSFGGANHSTAFADAIRYAMDHKVVLVASSGNNGAELSTHYPSGYPGVISVGASDDADQVASFSNFGTAVDLVAPGGGGALYSGQTMMGPRAAGTTMGAVVDAQHIRSSGTSFSSPMVAAAVAMLLHQRPLLTPHEIRQILCRSADDIQSAGWNLKSSYGRLNLHHALQCATPPRADIASPAVGQPVQGSVAISGSAAGQGFQQYILEYGTGKEPSTWTPIAQGTNPVGDSVLGTLQAGALPGGDYTIRLRALTAGPVYGEDRVTIFVGVAGPASRPGWPSPILINSETPTVMDLDGQDHLETLLAVSRSVQVYTSSGTAFRAGTYDNAYAWPSGPVGVGDLDGDGELEFGNMSKSGASSAYPEFHEVRFWKLDGSTAPGWPVPLIRPNDFVPHTLAPTVTDVDGDGRAEVIFPSITAVGGYPRLHLVNGDATPRAGWPVTLTSSPGAYIHCTSGIADIDGDGELDIVVADSSGRVHAFRLNGQYLAGWPKLVSDGMNISQEVALSDLDRDGGVEIIAAFYNGVVTVMDGSGNTKPGWPKNLGNIPRPPAMADLDGDGDLELAIGTQAGTLHLLHHDGTSLPGWPKQVSQRIYSPCLVDLNSDGVLDIVASDGSRTIHAWNVAGTYFSALGFPFQLPGDFGAYSAPVVADLDGDGKLELVVVGSPKMYAYNLSATANPAAPPFTHMKCDAANTCRYVLPGVLQPNQRYLVDTNGGITVAFSGDTLLAGSSAFVGNHSAVVNSINTTGISVYIPPGLPPRWHDVWLRSPNASPTWLANAVLVVDDLHGDADGDGLSNQWEWEHGFDPLSHRAEDPASGASGDADGDGIDNLLEAIFLLDPHAKNTEPLLAPRREQDAWIIDYTRSATEPASLYLEWSPDLQHWWKPGDEGYPLGATHIDLHTEVPGEQNRRIVLPLANTAGFVRWLAHPDR